MSNVKRLAGNSTQENDIRAAEADHEQVKVTIALSPLSEFIIEMGIQRQVKRTRTAAVRELLDSAALDYLEAKGYSLDDPKFRQKYLDWLIPRYYTDVDPETGEPAEFRDIGGLEL